ncbi:hypothetical protein ABPG77_007175 [Micractinium sp. CCAP 211/92]
MRSGSTQQLTTAAASPEGDGVPSPPPLWMRPTCLSQGYGPWEVQPAADSALAPAELDYSTIVLQDQGAPVAELAASDLAQGAGPAQWPVILEELRSQCACCRLCNAQNQYSQAAAAVIRCKRWSYRAADGACRLYSPDVPGQQAVSWVGGGVTEEQQAWFSGSAERPQMFDSSYTPPPGTAPQQQCLVLTASSGGTFPGSDSGGGGGGGGIRRSPPPRAPPPRRPPPSPPRRPPPIRSPPSPTARRPPSAKPPSPRPPPPRAPLRPPPQRKSPPPPVRSRPPPFRRNRAAHPAPRRN